MHFLCAMSECASNSTWQEQIGLPDQTSSKITLKVSVVVTHFHTSSFPHFNERHHIAAEFTAHRIDERRKSTCRKLTLPQTSLAIPIPNCSKLVQDSPGYLDNVHRTIQVAGLLWYFTCNDQGNDLTEFSGRKYSSHFFSSLLTSPST